MIRTDSKYDAQITYAWLVANNMVTKASRQKPVAYTVINKTYT